MLAPFNSPICTGLRISEALALRRDEVDLKQGILSVKESKRRRFRLVPPSALRPLEEYKVKRTRRFPEASFFFVNRRGDRLPYTTVRITFQTEVASLAGTAVASDCAALVR